MRKVLLAAAMVLAVGVGQAKAAVIYLTSAELAGFSSSGFTGVAPASVVNLLGGNYSVQWNSTADGLAVTHTNSLTLAAPRGTGGDVFRIAVFNNNGNAWNFSVSINDGGVQASGPFLVPNNGGSQVFEFTLAGALTQVNVTVGQTLPIAGVDRGAEYHLAVPEPASMLLLGAGLLGLAGVARRRR